jgi:hypothetical protein
MPLMNPDLILPMRDLLCEKLRTGGSIVGCRMRDAKLTSVYSMNTTTQQTTYP